MDYMKGHSVDEAGQVEYIKYIEAENRKLRELLERIRITLEVAVYLRDIREVLK